MTRLPRYMQDDIAKKMSDYQDRGVESLRARALALNDMITSRRAILVKSLEGDKQHHMNVLVELTVLLSVLPIARE